MDGELIALAAAYAAETGLSRQVCLDLLTHDLEPPPRSRVDDRGYTPAEVRAFLAEQKKRNRDDADWDC